MKRRKIDPETKMTAVLEGLKGESSIADLCRQGQISESFYYRWRDKFLEGGSQALTSRNDSSPEAAVKAGISELERIMGKQAVQIEILKKNFPVRPELISLACGLKDSGYSVTAIGTALGWHRGTFYQRLQTGQGAGHFNSFNGETL
jgi:transposase-like protein